jgi:hypothetical protein
MQSDDSNNNSPPHHCLARAPLYVTLCLLVIAGGGCGANTTHPEIENSDNSIVSMSAGTRTDPEGVAPADNVDQITWKDSRGADRTMFLGAYLHQYDFTFDDGQQIVTRSVNDDAYGHEGFGYVVSHNDTNGNSPLGKANAPTSTGTEVFVGAHHAIHQVQLIYDRDIEGGGNGIKIPVVIEWFVATGRDHPVWSVTWKVGDAVNPGTNLDVYRMDTRGPYGSLNFDGAANRGAGDAIGGVAWGDFGQKFMNTDAQLTLLSPWTYNTANIVCFTQAWTANTNAEMGIVQTKLQDMEMGNPDRVEGRERGHVSTDAFTNKGDCKAFVDNRVYTMPCVNGWPYQLMNYDWDPTTLKPAGEATGAKLIAWGTPYGYLGASSFDLFDYSGSADGRGDRAYATYIVLGPKCRFSGGTCDQSGEVANSIAEIEALCAATINNVTVGSVVTEVPKGPGATENKTIANGYNDTYAVYYLNATDNAVSFRYAPAAGKPVNKPIFVIQNYTLSTAPRISVNGTELTINTGNSNSEAFVSHNLDKNELWITLNRMIDAAVDIALGQ